MRTAAFLLIVWSAAAGAADPGTAAAAPPLPAEAAARSEAGTPGASTAASQPAPSTAAPAAADSTQAEAASASEFKPPAGYKTRTRGDETFYCRRETPIGTRFPIENCYTQEQLQRIMRSGQSMRDDVSRRQKSCSGASCIGG